MGVGDGEDIIQTKKGTEALDLKTVFHFASVTHQATTGKPRESPVTWDARCHS